MLLKKTLSLLLITISLGLLAQRPTKNLADKKKAEKIAEADSKVFGNNDKDFKITSAPEKWNNESAVILCQKFDYSYVRSGMSKLLFTSTRRRRIKINDNNAIKEFSVFYFMESSYSDKKENVGFRIIKSDGTIKKVNLKDAVEVKANEVPSFYQSNYSYYNTYKKIAIPNLSVGDIIDYYYLTESVRKQDGIESFSPFIFRLNTKYPIVKQKYYFNVDKGFKVSFRTFNGAPKIQQGAAGVNKYGKVKDVIKTYLLEDENTEKYKAEYWKYPYTSDPTIKFQVNFIPKAMVNKTELLITDAPLVDKPIDLKEIEKRMPKREGLISSEYAAVIAYLRKYYKTETDPVKKAEVVYEYLRYKFYNSLFFGYYSSYADEYERGAEYPVKDNVFTNTMLNLLKKLKIKAQFVVAVNRHYGNLSDVLLTQELISGIKVKDRYFFYFTNYTSSDFIPSSILGSEAITFDYATKYDKIPYQKTNITSSNYKSNNVSNKIDITINEDFSTIDLDSKKTYKGATKGYFTQLALYQEDYFDKDKRKFDPDYEKNHKENIPSTKRLSKSTQFKIAEKKRKEEAEKKEKKEKKYKQLKKYHEDDFEIDKYNNFNLVSDGRFIESPTLIVEENYTIKSLLHKAGNNYLFSIGELIGSQFELEKEDMERSSDIHLPFPKSFNNSIKIKIPTGYKVEGLDKLNFNVDNVSGSFISTAKQDGNYIVLTTTKNYKILNAKKEDWKNFIAFLEAAYNFSQKKVILKKI